MIQPPIAYLLRFGVVQNGRVDHRLVGCHCPNICYAYNVTSRWNVGVPIQNGRQMPPAYRNSGKLVHDQLELGGGEKLAAAAVLKQNRTIEPGLIVYDKPETLDATKRR